MKTTKKKKLIPTYHSCPVIGVVLWDVGPIVPASVHNCINSHIYPTIFSVTIVALNHQNELLIFLSSLHIFSIIVSSLIGIIIRRDRSIMAIMA